MLKSKIDDTNKKKRIKWLSMKYKKSEKPTFRPCTETYVILREKAVFTLHSILGDKIVSFEGFVTHWKRGKEKWG